MEMYGAADVISVLDAIDRGEVAVRIASADLPSVEFQATNGWAFRVFDDCGDWDYVDEICAPGGDWFDPWEDGLSTEWDAVKYWRPMNEDAWHWNKDGVSPTGWTTG